MTCGVSRLTWQLGAINATGLESQAFRPPKTVPQWADSRVALVISLLVGQPLYWDPVSLGLLQVCGFTPFW
jgi:hypothetical protein